MEIIAIDPLGLGIPIVGDRLYGQGQQPGEMLLHAAYLAFQHPVFGQSMTWESTLSF